MPLPYRVEFPQHSWVMAQDMESLVYRLFSLKSLVWNFCQVPFLSFLLFVRVFFVFVQE